jgi:hypothetical protein
MSDIGLIIPIAIVVVVALALGGSSGVSDPPDDEDEPLPPWVLRYPQETETFVSNAADDREERDLQEWTQNPMRRWTFSHRNGRAWKTTGQ